MHVPVKPRGGTFEWVLEPPQPAACDATWYIDGCLYDEYKRYARRTGFGIVVVDVEGSLIGYGSGMPPDWIEDAAGAELWALYTVAAMSPALPRLVTDCKGLCDTLNRCPTHACGHDKALARTWSMLRLALDNDFAPAAKLVTWMPSHTSVDATGRVTDLSRQT